jgi:hypothetical protein
MKTQSPYDFNPAKIRAYREMPLADLWWNYRDASESMHLALDVRQHDKYANDAQACREELKRRGAL